MTPPLPSPLLLLIYSPAPTVTSGLPLSSPSSCTCRCLSRCCRCCCRAVDVSAFIFALNDVVLTAVRAFADAFVASFEMQLPLHKFLVYLLEISFLLRISVISSLGIPVHLVFVESEEVADEGCRRQKCDGWYSPSPYWTFCPCSMYPSGTSSLHFEFNSFYVDDYTGAVECYEITMQKRCVRRWRREVAYS